MIAREPMPSLNPGAAASNRVVIVKGQTYLSAQLRDSAPYLKDAGWHETATLLVAAANEIETLQQQLSEHRIAPSMTVDHQQLRPDRQPGDDLIRSDCHVSRT
jgi:hypothetical protein